MKNAAQIREPSRNPDPGSRSPQQALQHCSHQGDRVEREAFGASARQVRWEIGVREETKYMAAISLEGRSVVDLGDTAGCVTILDPSDGAVIQNTQLMKKMLSV